MRKLLIFILLFVFSVILLSASCAKSGGPCEEPLDIASSSAIVATFKDSSGRYLYEEINPFYNKDSLKIFDQNSHPLFSGYQLNIIPNTNFKFYEITFGNIYDNMTDEFSFNSEICKNIIIQYSYNERDTIQTCFKSKRYKCGALFETLKVYHKGQLLTSVTNKTDAYITLIKP